MRFRSLGEFISAAAAVDDVKIIHGADLDLEVGCLTELAAEKDGPLLVFDGFAGYPEKYAVATNVYRNSFRRYALAMGLPFNGHPIETLENLRASRRTLRLVPPRMLSDGPVLAHSLLGDDVDVGAFPAPRWHSGDGGRYIGTGDILVLRDPETGRINFGTYRASVQDRSRVSVWIINYKQGRVILEKYWNHGLVSPAALVLGCDPLTFMASANRQKYEYAGALHGGPVELVEAPLTRLPIPAGSELVFEGEIPPLDQDSALEGPFGEWPGYYSHTGYECVLRVKRISHNGAPVIHGAPPLRPLLSWGADVPGMAVELWDHLERCGVTDVTGVWGHCYGLFMVIAIKQRYPGHAEQALTTSLGRIAGGMYGTTVVVDDDIDPTNMRDVLWALCTRADPAKSVQIVRDLMSSDLDPRLSPEQKATGDYVMGRMLINACKPWRWREAFPVTNVFSEQERDSVRTRWADVLQEIELMAAQQGFKHQAGPAQRANRSRVNA